MKIYLDLVLLINFGINLLFLLAINTIFNEKTKYSRLILSSVLASSMLIVYLFDYFIFLFVKIFGGVFLVWLGLGINKIFIKSSLFYFLEYSLTGIVESFKIEGTYLILAIILVIILLMIQSFKKESIIKNHFKYNISVTLGNKVINTEAFLDTGNQATLDNIPIIFLNKKYMQQHLIPYKNASIKTVNDYCIITCYKPEVFCIKMKKRVVTKEVLIAFKDIDEFECLLNCNIII